MEQQQQGPDDEDDFLESLRRAAARTSSEGSSAEGVPVRPAGSTERTTPVMPRVSTTTVDALRELEARIAGLEAQVRRLNDDRDRVVADVADAVVARLDARWARSLSQDVDDTAG